MLQLKEFDSFIYKIETKFRVFSVSSYLIIGDDLKILIDTGFIANNKAILNFFNTNDIKIQDINLILNTHCHLDHSVKNKFLKAESNAELRIHQADKAAVESLDGLMAQVGSFTTQYKDLWKQRLTFWGYEGGCPVDKIITENEIIDLGNHKLRVIHTPGHTLGHCSFLLDEEILIAGDMGFESLWYGNERSSLIDYIRSYQKLLELDLKLVLSSHLDPVDENITGRYKKRLAQLQERDEKILDLLEKGNNSIEKLVEAHPTLKNRSANSADKIWQDFGERNQILQHLKKLEREGKIIRTINSNKNEIWEVI